jgi:hypothetical protein
MKINRELNIVIELPLDEGGILHIHSTPIADCTFKEHFRILSKTFARLMNDGLHITAGPRVAYLMLEEVVQERFEKPAEKEVEWNKVKGSLIGEIIRLSNVAFSGPEGWATLPLELAIQRGMFSEGELELIYGELTFFTLLVHMNGRKQAQAMLEAGGPLWGFRVTSLDFTALVNSLRTSTPVANTGENPQVVYQVP